jgi:hypothetical protein
MEKFNAPSNCSCATHIRVKGVVPRAGSYHYVVVEGAGGSWFFNELGKPYAAKSVASMLR